ncbi:MAG: hypothetical protein J5748_04540 [Bacteroidales bacterium]|nr:hypothetical protein [Bacteroidales bacterium]
MKKILILLIAGALATFSVCVSSPTRSGVFCASAYAQDDDITKLYEQYLTPQEQALLDRFEETKQKSEEAQAVKHNKMMIALIISIMVGLIPFVYLLVKSFKENTWENNVGGTVWGLVIALAGGVLLFAINYGIFWFRMNHEGLFNGIVTYGLVAALIIGVIYLLNKKG